MDPVPTNLSTQADSWNGVAVVAVDGEIDLSTAPRLGQALEQALVPGAPLVVDMARVEFIDSAGTHTLVLADRAASDRGGRLLIVPSVFVSRVLEVSGLDRAFAVYGELREALAAAAGEPARPAHPGPRDGEDRPG